MKDEIVLYQSDELPEHIEVRIDDEKETIWLTQNKWDYCLIRIQTP